MFRWLLSVVVSILLWHAALFAQSDASNSARAASEQAGASSIRPNFLYIMFLHFQAKEAQMRASSHHRGANSDVAAERMHVQAGDISVLDSIATQYMHDEMSLAEEGQHYYQSRMLAGVASDPGPYRQRRDDLALAAMTNLRSRLSPASVAGLEAFIKTDLQRSIH